MKKNVLIFLILFLYKGIIIVNGQGLIKDDSDISDHHNELEYNFLNDFELKSKLKQNFVSIFQILEVEESEYPSFFEYIKINDNNFFKDIHSILLEKSDSNIIKVEELFEGSFENFKLAYKGFKSGVIPSEDFLSLNLDNEVYFKNNNDTYLNPIFTPNGPCENTSFQDGTTNGWNGAYGTSTISVDGPDKTCSGLFDSYNATNDECCPLFGSCSPWTPADGYVQINQNNINQNVGFNSAANNTAANAGTAGVHTVMTGGFDPMIPANALSVIPPNGNNSIRLGYANNGYNAQAIRQTFLVTDNNKNFIYHFAAVLNDPQTGHQDYELPFLKIRMYDQNNDPIECATLDVSTSNAASNAGFVQVTGTDNRPLFWKNWTSITVPLNPYMGQNVTIEFITSNCTQSGHYGYAYISAECNPQEILASSPSICGGQSVTLTAPPGLDTYTWSGPGIVSGQGTDEVVVNQPGNYNVTMTTLTTPPFVPCGFSIDTIMPGNNDYPVASFEPSPSSLCLGDPVTFTNNSFVIGTSSIDSVQWDFNSDGIIDDNSMNPSYIYSSNGNYTATLIVWNNGCQDDTSMQVVINPTSTANFSSSVVCLGLATDFTDMSSAGVDSWNWDFDNDGIVDNINQNPSYTFPTSGTFPVNLEVSVGGNCTHDTTINITVNPTSVANFTPQDVCFGTPSQFNDISTGGVDTWGWDFDNDGIIDNTTQNPSYTFPASGSFPVTLEVSLGGNCSHDTIINVVVNSTSTAIFTPSNVCDGLSTQFLDSSIGGVNQWGWDFDNDGVIDDVTQNPTYTYAGVGSYPVYLEVSVNGLCAHDTIINVNVNPNPIAAFSFSDVCFGAATNFTDLSNGNGGTIDTWNWDFTNNGTVDNVNQNPSNGYSSSGTYTVELYVQTSDGCSDSTTLVVDVDAIPSANFGYSRECLGSQTNFYDSSSVVVSNVNQWSWDFGDGVGTSLNQNPSYTFTASGTYNASLTVTSDSGCINTIIIPVTVSDNPIASFIADTACSSSFSNFTDLTTGTVGIETWSWDFGNDGSIEDNTQHPNYVFVGAGTYPVNLAVVDSFGCVHDTTLNVTVSENPIAAFTFSDECFGVNTSFTNQSLDNGGTTPIDSWEWDFDGDGVIDDNANNPNPTYLFATEGDFQTTLIVTSTLGCKDTIVNNVDVDAVPVANFGLENVCLNASGSFIDSSSVTIGNVNLWSWDFDDGFGTSTWQTPSYTYNNPGIYNVTLDIVTDSGCTHSVTLPVEVYPNPTANFDTTDVCLNVAAQFTDLSNGNGGTINSWEWDFTNDGIVDDLNQNSSYNYSSDGVYNVELVVSTTSGCKDTLVKTVTIFPMPNADFSFTNACYMDSVLFVDNSNVTSGTIDQWSWNLGNNQTSINQNPSVFYSNEGIYSVELIATTNNGCSDTITKSGIEVWPLPVVNFGPTAVCINYSTQFLDSSSVSNQYTSNNITQWSWDFGNGIGYGATQNPVYAYPADGSYLATLVVTTNNNCVDSATKPVTVYPQPIVDFVANTFAGCTPVNSNFSSTSTLFGGNINTSTFEWDLNADGLTDLYGPNPLWQFTNPSNSSVRSFDITLTVTSEFGCVDSITKTNYINAYPNPIASFMFYPDDDATIVNNEIEFTDQSIIANTWQWDLGDGTQTTVVNPVHQYADTGFYWVTLNIENTYGCSDSTAKLLRINPIYAIWIPNAFTPNSDNTNDYFFVDGYGIKELQVQIYDRWGLKIYDGVGVDQAWDGTYKGQLVQLDVYVYKVRAKDVFDEWHDYIGKVTVVE